MNNVLRLAIVDPNDAKRDALKNMLLGMDMIWLEAECSRYEFFTDIVSQTSPEIALVSIDTDAEKGLDLVSRLGATAPDCAVLVVSSSNDGKLILRAMRAGAYTSACSCEAPAVVVHAFIQPCSTMCSPV